MLDLDETLLEHVSKMPLSEFAKSLLALNLETEEGEAEAIQLIRLRGATDVKFYAWFFFPHYCTREFNQYHEDVFAGFKWRERDVRRARAAPRGSAKSTISTLVKPLHDACYGLEKFILILSSTTPLANKKLKDIRAEVESNELLNLVYGTRFPKKKVGESEFGVHADAGICYFVAVGKGSEVRGIRIGQYRPTKVVSDDVEYSEEVHNEVVRDKTESWYFEDVGKVGDSGTNFDFVGTILHKDSLLSKLIKNPAYESKVYKAIISWSEREDLWNEWRRIYCDWDNQNRIIDSTNYYHLHERELLKGTKVLWPEKETYLDHMKDMVEIGKRAFMKEKQNDPLGATDAVFDTFHWYRETPDGLLILSNNKLVHWQELEGQGLAALDPATGKNKPKKGAEGDYSVLAVGFKDRFSRLFVHWDWTKRSPPSRAIQAIFESQERFQYSKCAVETNLFRELIMPNIISEKERREAEKKSKIEVSFYEVENTENKRERITTIEPRVTHGKILFNVALSQTFKQMFEDFPRADHDDSPDCVEMLWRLANNAFRARIVNADHHSGR